MPRPDSRFIVWWKRSTLPLVRSR